MRKIGPFAYVSNAKKQTRTAARTGPNSYLQHALCSKGGYSRSAQYFVDLLLPSCCYLAGNIMFDSFLFYDCFWQFKESLSHAVPYRKLSYNSQSLCAKLWKGFSKFKYRFRKQRLRHCRQLGLETDKPTKSFCKTSANPKRKNDSGMLVNSLDEISFFVLQRHSRLHRKNFQF